jgi:hypothetical protein
MKIFISEDEKWTSILYNNGFERRCIIQRIKLWSRLDLIEWLCWNDLTAFIKMKNL